MTPDTSRHLTVPDREALIATYRDDLLKDVIPFWLKHGIDREHGGVLTCLDRDGSVIDTDKSGWFQGRFAWMLSTLAADCEGGDAYLEPARNVVAFLKRHDETSGGRLGFELTQDGRSFRTRRYMFSETFAVVAYAAWYRASGEAWAAERATHWFDQITNWLDDPASMPHNYPDKYDAGIRPMKGLAVPMIMLVTAQELRKATGDPRCEARIDRSIEEIRRDFMSDEFEAVLETVTPEGEFIDHTLGRTINPGHALEAGWFILSEAAHRSDAALVELGCRIIDWSWQWGWDDPHGGIIYFRDVKHKPVQEYWHDMKFWWPQNEAVIATLAAYLATGDEKYLGWHRKAHDYTHSNFPDPEFGEWFGYLHRDGRRSSDAKGTLYKGPFHVPRMQWRCWQMLEHGHLVP